MKTRKLGGVVDYDACLDLLIADVRENLPIPRISNPSSSVPNWNMADVDDFVETLFAFAVQHLSDDAFNTYQMMELSCSFFQRDLPFRRMFLNGHRSMAIFNTKTGGGLMNSDFLPTEIPKAR